MRKRNEWIVFLLVSGAICWSAGARAGRAGAQSRPDSSGGGIAIANEPASEGRPITPAGSLVMDATTGEAAVGSLPVAFVRSPDHGARDGAGRYLIAVNSGYGVQFNAATNKGEQSLTVIDLNGEPAPEAIQNVYFPTPQSANVGAAFSQQADVAGNFTLYVSGGFENKVWMFRFHPGSAAPIAPASPGPDTKVTAPFLSVEGFAMAAPTPRFNDGAAPVYPTGLALGADGDSLLIANNLGDTLGIVRNLRGERALARIYLGDGRTGHFVYPYGVAALAEGDAKETTKVYVSCWATGQVAVVDPRHPGEAPKFVAAGRHPTAMIFNAAKTRLYVVNSDADSVTAIDTAADRVVETIDVRLTEKSLPGTSPEDLALSADGATLYVAEAHANAVAVVALSSEARGAEGSAAGRSAVRGFIPTGQYPSAVTVANGLLFIGNGKGTGFANSSLEVDNSGRTPRMPNDRFPKGAERHHQGSQYDVSLIAGNFEWLAEPDGVALGEYTQQVMRNDGLVGEVKTKLFAGASPIRHVIYVIRENRTYDQVFGDMAKAGDGTRADGDARLAIFGGGDAARRPGGPPQNITPNAHALALRFGLLDRFFVNSEASPDGHNWALAAISTDFVDKVFRWNYSDRGQAYDFEWSNREPELWARKDAPPLLALPATAADLSNYIRRYIPYLHGARGVDEPETLYLWDDAARAGISYHVDGQFTVTFSEGELAAFNANRERTYPDLTATAAMIPARKALEGHEGQNYREFDIYTPDALTTESYRAAKETGGKVDPLISAWNTETKFRGYSRIADWLEEFRGYVAALANGKGETLPEFNVVYLPNDHTDGMRARMPTAQFYAAENDYALGLMVEEVSSSPYWKDTAILVLEDDAQDGPDHVDAHRSPALVISAYNRPGALVHEFHSTVSLIRTMELLVGMPPMNQLDASAAPIDIFQGTPDLRPYKAVLPDVAADNLITPPARDAETAAWIARSGEMDLTGPDLADPQKLNGAIWYSVRGSAPMPKPKHLPVYDALRTATNEEAEEQLAALRGLKRLMARLMPGVGPRQQKHKPTGNSRER